MKKCSKCEIEKFEADFRNNRNTCKSCEKEYRKKYQQTDKYKEAKLKHKNSEKYKLTTHKYNRSDKRQAALDRYKESGKYDEYQKPYQYNYKRSETGKLSTNKTNVKRRKTKRGKRQDLVGSMVQNAIKNGTIIKPTHCQTCFKSRKLEAHHHSYELGFELDVIFLCKRCHIVVHKSLKELDMVPDFSGVT